MNKVFKLRTGKKEIFYLWVPEKGNLYIDLESKAKLNVSVYDNEEKPITDKLPLLKKDVEGVFIVKIESENEGSEIKINIGQNNFLFVLPGFGLVPSHFEKEEDIMYFYQRNLNLWTYIPENLENIFVQTTLHKNFSIDLTRPSGKKEKLIYLTHPLSPYNTSIIENVEEGWYKFDIKTETVPFRFLIYGCYPLFFENPSIPFKYKKFYFVIKNKKNKEINSSIKFYSLNNPIGLFNKLSSGKDFIFLPPVKTYALISSDITYKETIFSIKKTENLVKLEDFISKPEGWVCGDLHMHSCINSDGADPPEVITETAICNGLDFIFISDSPEIIKRCEKYNKSGRFIVSAGQEIGNPFFHINVLNGKEDLQVYSYEDKPEKTLEILIEKVKEYEEKGENILLMLNHPSHLPETMKKFKYFNSWWIVDKYEEFRIVENFDFETWFKKLNEGKRIVGLWTTDSHDSSLIVPGLKRNYVYVGRNFNMESLINGIKKGNVFCTRYPGVMIDFKVNGKIPGEEVFVKEDVKLNLRIFCQARRPIKKIEVIADGKIVHLIDGAKSFILNREILLNSEYKWLILRVYLFEEGWREDLHSTEPLVYSGCSAFTNPVWIKKFDRF